MESVPDCHVLTSTPTIKQAWDATVVVARSPRTETNVHRVLDKSVGRSLVEEMFELIDLSDYLATVLTD